MEFKLTSKFEPTGDQPSAIKQLYEGLLRNDKHQVLLGVTGSGKTFTIANVINQIQRPTLVLSHNKTLAAQLYAEFKQFFPENAVKFFISYYDYYQPEAFIPTTNTYIEKDISINEEIEKLRIDATSSLLTGRRDIIIVASVSCIYGIGNPEDINNNTIHIKVGDKISRDKFLRRLVDSLYSRTEFDLERGKFRVKGDTVDIFPVEADFACKVIFFSDEIEEISTFNPISGNLIEHLEQFTIFPTNIFVTSKEKIQSAIRNIHIDLGKQIDFFKETGKIIEAKRLEDRVTYDLEMMRELGYCSGIENYSRYFDGRKPGTRPFCLLDYFPDDYLMVVDESHVTVPQIRAMYGGDRSRKQNLVEYGFRLPSALDNRPLKFPEFEALTNQVIYVSATPADYELAKANGVIVEQIVRPTGLIDPIIEVKPSLNQIDDLLNEIQIRTKNNERTLITTLTKRMAEELSKYLSNLNIKTKYLHSGVLTIERVEILNSLRTGEIDVLVGVNLLREGLDLPEVSLVAILDADKEGFLRSEKSLTQTAGRAARNINSKVIFYADTITDSMQKTIDETNRKRSIQLEYNRINNITPKQIIKDISTDLVGLSADSGTPTPDKANKIYVEGSIINSAADPLSEYLSYQQLEKLYNTSKTLMQKAAKDLDFMEAARLRDEMYMYKNKMEQFNVKPK